MVSQLISRIRRNHGLEHATIHVLSEKHKGFSAQGNSHHLGFSLNIYGNLTEEQVKTAVFEAHRRLQNGEHHLAVHPNCGTVLLTTAAMTTLAAQITLAVEQKRNGRDQSHTPTTFFNAIYSAILPVTMTLIISRPIGMFLQSRYTVDGRIGDMEIVSIEKVPPSPVTRFFQLLLTGGRQKLTATSYRIVTKG